MTVHGIGAASFDAINAVMASSRRHDPTQASRASSRNACSK